jgi:hypothetical protein
VNALDAADGTVVWSRNAASDTDKEVPEFGFTSSPLVVDDAVIVAVAGQLVAYDTAAGDLRWSGPKHGGGYSSPHLLTIDGVAQVLLLSGAGATSVAPADGTLLEAVNGGDAGVVQGGQQAGLAVEAGEAFGVGGEGRGEELDGDFAVEGGVQGAPDHADAAFADLVDQAVVEELLAWLWGAHGFEGTSSDSVIFCPRPKKR